MPVTININNLTLCHQGSGGIAIATLPDVCKTPPGPVPVPYPNIAFSKQLKKGTKTIKVDGGNMAGNKGSEFSQSIGDEPGVAGGVKSSTNLKEATWLTYSLDVKLEGKNACRLTDKMLMNHGNTVCLAGEIQPILPPTDPKCLKIWEKIKELIEAVRPPTPAGGFPQGLQGLAKRWEEIANNVGKWGLKADGTPMLNPDGTRVITKKMQTHLGEYGKVQKNLQEELERWDNKDCDNKGGGGGLPRLAKEYAKQTPEYGPGAPLEPIPASATPSVSVSPQDIATALGVSVGIVVTVIVISRLIRCIPPLWPLQASPI